MSLALNQMTLPSADWGRIKGGTMEVSACVHVFEYICERGDVRVCMISEEKEGVALIWTAESDLLEAQWDSISTNHCP